MNWQLIVGVVCLVGAAALWWGEEWELRRAHARCRTRALDALQIGGAYAFLVAGLAVGSQPGSRPLVLLPLGIAVIALASLPMAWVLRVGGPRAGLGDTTHIRSGVAAPTPSVANVTISSGSTRSDIVRVPCATLSPWVSSSPEVKLPVWHFRDRHLCSRPAASCA